jgi:PAS domain S-box-containing protein
VFKKAFHASPTTVALATSPDNRLIDVNDTWLHLTGYSRDAVIGRTPLELGLLDDPQDFDRINERVLANNGRLRDFECRFRSSDHRLIVGLVSIEQFEVEQQAFRIVMIADVTALRQAEATLSQVTQNVIEAQEWERLRIARDLHDDIGQRLAVWQFTMDRLLQDVRGGSSDVEARLHDLQAQARSISADLQSLSRELHSPTLSLISIDKSLKRLCQEMGARLDIRVDFTTSRVPASIPSDVSLCLFRVLQEALTNIVKHSGTRRAVVRLAGTGDTIEMTIRDFGQGLSAWSAVTNVGIGLLTMRERVAIVKGTFSISSPPDGGLEIDIRIPVAPATNRPIA